MSCFHIGDQGPTLYLIVNEFRAFTDHSSLSKLLGAKDPSGKTARWRMRPSEFTGIKVLYRPGQWNSISDMLSQLDKELPETQAGDLEPLDIRGDILIEEGDEGEVLNYFSTYDSDEEQGDLILDERCIAHDQVLCAMAHEKKLEAEMEQLPSVVAHEELVIEQGKDQLCKMIRARVENVERIYPTRQLMMRKIKHIAVPASLAQNILKLYYHTPMGAHLGKASFIVRCGNTTIGLRCRSIVTASRATA